MSSPRPVSAFNALPPLVSAIAIVMVTLEVMFQLGARGLVGGPQAVGWRIATIQEYGFSNRALDWMIETGSLRLDYIYRLVTYPFVHLSFMHALFATAMILALGKFVGERMPQWALLVLFFGSAASGALIFGLILPDGPGLVGA
ncbi:MAG: rhomboid family intramembrane serine protease, partial [Pseudomonadota bacterium]